MGFVYLFPAIVALVRSKRHPGGVIVINLFLGWTFLGWVIALAMAVSGDTWKDAQGRA
ncbi:MAG TPA: superinfection immunity protein [Candidatus Limnocylindria bacterium]|nr:superinfection immunity protein [Candidatus Limnocylindria bacterium]